jgi:hypothetical protein
MIETREIMKKVTAIVAVFFLTLAGGLATAQQTDPPNPPGPPDRNPPNKGGNKGIEVVVHCRTVKQVSLDVFTPSTAEATHLEVDVTIDEGSGDPQSKVDVTFQGLVKTSPGNNPGAWEPFHNLRDEFTNVDLPVAPGMPGYSPVRLPLCLAGTEGDPPNPSAIEIVEDPMVDATALNVDVTHLVVGESSSVTNRCEDDPATELPVDESDIDLDSIVALI